MNSLFMVLNAVVMILAAGGCLLLVIAAWKSMKALESISTTLEKMNEKQK